MQFVNLSYFKLLRLKSKPSVSSTRTYASFCCSSKERLSLFVCVSMSPFFHLLSPTSSVNCVDIYIDKFQMYVQYNYR